MVFLICLMKSSYPNSDSARSRSSRAVVSPLVWWSKIELLVAARDALALVKYQNPKDVLALRPDLWQQTYCQFENEDGSCKYATNY